MKGRIGLIGGGNMSAAIVGGILKAGIASSDQILVSDISGEARKKMKETFRVETTADNREAAAFGETVFLAVKPYVCQPAVQEIKTAVGKDAAVISIAAGQSLKKLENWFGQDVPLIRAMPNTPALVGEGMTAFCCNRFVTEEQARRAAEIFGSFGKAERLPESLFDVVTAVSGSSPAYVYMFIEAMADAAVAGGMERKTAYRICAQAVLGSAKMVLETGRHPGELKDMVCSPGGTTIEAVLALEEKGMRAAVEKAVAACLLKSKSMEEL